MRLYVSGPMSNLPEFNVPAFNEAAAELRAAGYEVVNPADCGVDDSMTWADYLRQDLRLLLDCDAVALLPGWESSRGAALEMHVARRLGMPVRMVNRWLLDVEGFVTEGGPA